MAVVDSLYHGYGDECGRGAPCAAGSTSPYCNGVGKACQGVNADYLPKYGNRYFNRVIPLLDRVKAVVIKPVDCPAAFINGCVKPLS
jgi:hypothetical protein